MLLRLMTYICDTNQQYKFCGPLNFISSKRTEPYHLYHRAEPAAIVAAFMLHLPPEGNCYLLQCLLASFYLYQAALFSI